MLKKEASKEELIQTIEELRLRLERAEEMLRQQSDITDDSGADITPIKKAQESLRRSEARWNAAIESFSGGAIIATEDEQVIYWNPAARAMHGFTRIDEGIEPLEKTTITFQLWTPDGSHILELDEWPMRRIKRGESVQNLELRIRRPGQGWEKILSYSGAMVETGEGEHLIFLSCYDLTELRRTEEALRESEERLRMQRQRMPIGCIVYDEHNCFSQINPAAEAIFGYTEPELRGRHANIFVPEAARTHVDGIMRRLAEGDMTANSVNENLAKDGRIILCQWTNTPLRDAAGQHMGFLSMVQDVTEQRKAEAKLRESEQFYRQTLESIPGMVFTTRPDGYCDYQSQQWVDFTGVPMNEHLGDGWNKLLYPEDRPQAYAAWRAAVEERAPYDLEYRVRGRDGQYEWFKVRGVPIRDDAGRIARWFGVATNIEAIKRTEAALREVEQRFCLALRNAPVSVAVQDRDLRYVWTYNQQTTLPEEIIGKLDSDIFTSEEAAQITKIKRRVLDEGIELREQMWLSRSSGRIFLDVCWEPVLNEHGKVTGVASATVDLTPIKVAEEALQESESRLRLGQQAAKIGVFEWDIQTGVNVWSPDLEKMYGLAPGAFEGTQQAWEERVHSEDRDEAVAAVRRAFEVDGPAEGEWRVVWPDGSVHWVLGRFQLFKDHDGKPLRLAGVNIDISARKQAEMELKAALYEKEVLLKEIHHRVKNNMQVISSLVDLQAGQLQDEAVRTALQDVTHRVRSMALVHEKLYQSTDMARIDFAEYVQSLLDYLWRSYGATASRIRLVFNLNPVTLPIHAAVPCGLILNELATNALKHAFCGRDGGEVQVSLQTGEQVCIRIRDDGIGLPVELDWRQAKSLGLHLVQILAKQLSATVEVSNREGTEFSVSFGGTNL